MYIQYTGFKVTDNSRAYNFHVIDATREPREFTVKIQSATNHWVSLKLQDGPGLCFERLEQELKKETPDARAGLNLHITEQDIREYQSRHYPPVKTYGHKEKEAEVNSLEDFDAQAVADPAALRQDPS